MIDNTPPIVTIGAVRHSGGAAHIELEADDAASPCAAASTRSTPPSGSRGSRGWRHRFGQREKFALDLTGLAPGEHLVVIRAADSANNTGVAKVVF